MSLPPIPSWSDQASGASFSEPAECAARVGKFERRIRIRNGMEYAAAVLGTILFGVTAFGAFDKGEMMIGLSCLAIIVGVFVAMLNLKRRGGNLDRRPEDNCAAHLRRQYSHQHQLLRDVPVWYIGPFIPGLVLFYLTITARVAERVGWADAMIGILQPAAISFGIMALVMLANWFGARHLQKKIDEIDALA